MTNARDKANIPSLNFSSTGIDDNATSTAITIDSSERVGIGTSSPSQLLHIENGDVLIKETGTSDPLINFATTSQTWTLRIDNSDSDKFQLRNATGGNTVFTADSSGNVGIGDTAPDGSLHITRSSSSLQFVLERTTSNTGKFGIGINNGLVFNDLVTSTERMRINSSGNVGIGTSSPSSLFHIESASSDPTLRITNKTVAAIDTGPDIEFWNNPFTGSTTNSYESGAIRVRKTSGSNNTHDHYMSFWTRQNSPEGINERMRIDSSGNVGIGTTSPDASTYFGGKILHIADSSNAGIMFNRTSSTAAKWSVGCNSGGNLDFVKENSVKMRIDSSGNVLIKKTTSGFNTAGFEVKSGDEPIYVTTENNYNLLVNRKSSDGDLIRFYRSTSQKGSITVSGETVSYNAFTGSHWSRFTDNSKPTILRGTVLETLDEMLDWYNLEYNITTTTKDEDGNDVTNTETFGVPHVLTDSQSVGDVITYNHEGTDYQATIVKEADVKHMMSKVSDTTDAKNVYGVFNCYDEEQSEEGYNDFLVASVGSFLVRIKANETIAKGDLLQSNGDGTAKVQSDDNVKSSSFAKVLSTTIIETYEDGSYLVPCSLMC
ncbi:hypothetical protein Jormungand_gp31 [Pelagibacter phage Jormungand EXVC012P]|nr:hypothetical protein Jormungand_gp31 [Pelagibacter phage Jormungand EXVC012P]QLF88559.1 hypothetical protein Ran_gp1 [Pelagibacter phage Ran EXVC014P]